MSYENETCEGCVYRVIPHGDIQPCEDCTDRGKFVPSLGCRTVRALEHIGDILCSLVDAAEGRKPVCDVGDDG